MNRQFPRYECRGGRSTEKFGYQHDEQLGTPLSLGGTGGGGATGVTAGGDDLGTGGSGVVDWTASVTSHDELEVSTSCNTGSDRSSTARGGVGAGGGSTIRAGGICELETTPCTTP